jgi:acylpyruvate hydrolase
MDDDFAVETGHVDVGTLLAHPDWRQIALRAAGIRHEIESLDYATLVPRPEKVICVGLNYHDHIAETGRTPPEYPTLFAKFARTLIGAHDPIQMPTVSDHIDWEAELGVVIGQQVRDADPTSAAAAIAGYTVINDISVRDYQNRTLQWLQGKAFEGTTPVGPWLVVSDGGEPAHFPISCTVDGEVVQSSNTAQLVFDPVTLVQYISTIITLDPGDVIATGTPGGVGHARSPAVFLKRGQTVVTSIEGIGTCANVCA